MLDFRILTFLAICEHKSFTKAAQALHITQPAVSQHMQALQAQLGTQLFTMEGRQVLLTAQGEQFWHFARSIHNDITRFTEDFPANAERESLRFGATLSIGEFTLPPILAKVMSAERQRNHRMYVDNTEILLGMLDSGEIDFAFIEGTFDKRRYGYRLLSHERFISIGSPSCKDRHPKPSLEELFGERLIIRESGSGTRGVLERILAERGLSTSLFHHMDEIGNLNVITYLVGKDLGISFLYEAAARDALERGAVCVLEIEGWHVVREFNFVYPLHARQEQRYLRYFEEFTSP